MKKRIICTLLLVFMLIGNTACGNSNSKTVTESNGEETEITTTTEETKVNTLDARVSVSDGVKDIDFGKAEFRVVTQERHNGDIVSDGENGDVINDEVFRRNSNIEQRYNIKIKSIPAMYKDNNIFIEKSVLANDDSFDLIHGQAVATSHVVLKGYVMPWQDIPYIDFTKPWWSKSTTDDLTVNGKTYLAIGDFALSALAETYAMYFDKNEAANYNLPDLYEIVRNGQWTIDKLQSLIKDIYVDVNGDSQRDIDDYYGFSSDPKSNADAYLWAFDNPVMKKNSEGIPEFCIKTEKINTIIDKIISLFYENTDSYVDDKYVGRNGYSEGLGRDMFKNGKCLFANASIGSSVTEFREFEHDYGIIPYPKFDDNQTEYKTMADGSHAVLGVPSTASNIEMIGAVTEVLCAETWKTVVPTYYDVALKVKGARDEESIEMLDLITESRVFDFGYIYDNWKGMAFCVEKILSQKDANFESYYAANESKAQKHYQEVVDMFFK